MGGGHVKLGRAYRILIDVTIGVIGFGTVLGIFGIVVPDLIESPFYGRLLSCTWLLALLLAIMIAAGAVMRTGRMRYPMVAAVALATIGILLAMAVALDAIEHVGWYRGWSRRELIALWAVVLIAPAVAIIHTGVLRLLRVESRIVAVLRTLTACCAFGAAACWITVVVISELAMMDARYWPVIAIVGPTFAVSLLGTLVGTAVVPVAALSATNRAARRMESVASDLRVTLACPKCRHEQTLPTGNSRCANCGAGLLLEVEEPRCECGYQLFKLVEWRCPECGRDVPEELRWGDGNAVQA